MRSTSGYFSYMKADQQQTKILFDANVVTMDPAYPSARWIAMSQGIIQAVGTTNSYETLKGAALINCEGRTVLPGFIDAHIHLRAFGEACVSMDLSPARGIRSIEDIRNAIKARRKAEPHRTWIRGRGYDEFRLAERRHPTRWDLDEVAPDQPVKLTHRSGHAHVLNTRALSLVGVSGETGDPPGGLIERNFTTGEPTGLLYEMGKFLSERIPPLDHQELRRGVHLANQAILSGGITSVQDASHLNDFQKWKEICSWKDDGLLKPRIGFMLGPEGFEQFSGTDFPYGTESPNEIRLSGVKAILDESTGRLLPTQTELNEWVLKVHRTGFQVAIHAIEGHAVESACSAIQYTLDRDPRPDHRHRIEHCSVCSPSLLRRMAELGIVVVTQPSFLFYHGDRYLETVPSLDLQHLYPVGSLLKAGITVAASSDCPIAPPNPLIGIYAAVSRMSQTGSVLGPDERIEPFAALRMYTSQAARVSFDEEIKGTITPGKLADLVVLNGDPTRIDKEKIKELEVGMTIVGGEIVWSKSA
jgi:predicted amidohydrolase YtcJ